MDANDGNILVGTITRKVICTLIKHRGKWQTCLCMHVSIYMYSMLHPAFGPASADPNSERRISPLVNWGTLECVYPRYPQIFQLSIDDSSRFDLAVPLFIAHLLTEPY